MLFINKNSFDPWFNIAADEFVMKHLQDNLCMVWRSTPCVVVGKHQHTLSEINHTFVEQNNIPVIRRITGGGTVYHDENCLNFSFITSAGQDSDKINFDKHTLPVRKFLQSVGIDARLSGKSNITVNGLKVSGNAAHLFKNRSIHHGTLLFATDVKRLEASTMPSANNYKSKAVQSNRANVVNITELLTNAMTIEAFETEFIAFLKTEFSSTLERHFTPVEIAAIEELANEKYRKWSWNFAYSPNYEAKREIEVFGNSCTITLKIKKGSIDAVRVSENNTTESIQLFMDKLPGINHSKPELIAQLQPFSKHLAPDEKQFIQLINQIL
jgi:lipoate-protein ligase A